MANTTIMDAAVAFDASLLRKMDRQGPRYTSYPTADRFSSDFGSGDYLQAITGAVTRGSLHPLSIYVHIPFCESVCYYCGCNKIVTRDRSKAATYLGCLKREIAMQGRLMAGANQVEQLHFGGGTPTYLSDEQMDELLTQLRRWFQFAPDAEGEYSIEVDPRTVTRERVHKLRKQGFNRISLGVQDFDPDVQKAVNRIQPEEETRAIIEAAREAGFRSISIDLIYGLPCQTLQTMQSTLDKVIDCRPDRIAIYNYAHMPHLFKPQRRIAEADMPVGDTKLAMLALCIQKLTSAGYIYIGMDHFALPDDDLAIAQRQGRLHRNFQGYSTHAETDLMSFGVSAISAIGAIYSQNAKTLDEYYERIDQGELPIVRGLRLGMDDLLRRIVIQMLMCHFELSITAIELAYPIMFRAYFSTEIEELRELEKSGLLVMDNEWITVTPRGRLLIRNICMVFDRHLRESRQKMPLNASTVLPLRYSRTL